VSNTYSQQEICDAANKIKAYCHETECKQCFFHDKSDGTCFLITYSHPAVWPHFSTQRWTAADITLAKALIMMGYVTATKTMRPDGHPSITVIKINDDGSTPFVDEITRDSFQALAYGEAIRLENIAGEESSAND
jgi:hypothetical protein